MHRDEDSHAQPANAVQDKRQHGAATSVSQARLQADIPFQAHLRLLEK
jgi:hypothetical protein